MSADFFQGAPDPASDPYNYLRQQSQAGALQAQGRQTPQGSMVGGQYVAPGAGSYVTQLASALAGGYKADQLRGAANASNILNGGPGIQSPIQQGLGWLRGLGSA